ncbi:MAG: 50S ribosomal protein L4 [Eubacterium sp.]|nr:50S ribosomal protein L4 [Eubacterium sp.]
MASVSVYNMDGKEVEKMDVNDSVFAAPINEHLLHKAVVLQLANKRQGTQKAKTRSEVRGGGRKPWRQKGTGHARQGSIRSPQWTGGGVVFAPTPRDYSFKMNRKEKEAALKAALSAKVKDSQLYVVDEFKFDEPKTKKMNELLSNMGAKGAFIVLGGDGLAAPSDAQKNAALSAKNLKGVRSTYFLRNEDKDAGKVDVTSGLNVYDILKYDTLVIEKNAIKAIEEVYA